MLQNQAINWKINPRHDEQNFKCSKNRWMVAEKKNEVWAACLTD